MKKLIWYRKCHKSSNLKTQWKDEEEGIEKSVKAVYFGEKAGVKQYKEKRTLR